MSNYDMGSHCTRVCYSDNTVIIETDFCTLFSG